jgi:hypothetical protein
MDHFYAAAYGNGRFVGVGEANMLIASSADAVTWTNRDTIGTEHLYGLTFADGHFVAVGYGALQPIYIISSTDGIHWSSPQSYPTRETLFAVAYGNGLYVAVGDQGTILTSSDLATWTLRSSGTTKRLRAITYTGTRFLVGGESATMITSIDGIAWTPSAPPSFDVTGLASGSGAVVAVGVFNGTEGRLHASPDGLGWPGQATVAPQPLNGVSYVQDRFIAVGNNGLIMQSDFSGCPSLSCVRVNNRMVLSWNGNYQLVSSANVAGPYSAVIGASSPYTNSLDQPQRFFGLRAP